MRGEILVNNRTGFKTQVTTHDNFSQTEQELFQTFKEAGVPDAVAEAIAHAYTKFMLGYITERGVGQLILDAGATEGFAIHIAKLFAHAKQSNAERATQTDGPYGFSDSPTPQKNFMAASQ